MQSEKFYLDGYKGIAKASTIIVPVGATVRLPDNPCKFVKLARWNATNDEQFTITPAANLFETDDEVYYGFDGVIAYQLFITQQTDLLPVNNTNQIVIRNPSKAAGGAAIYYTYFS